MTVERLHWRSVLKAWMVQDIAGMEEIEILTIEKETWVMVVNLMEMISILLMKEKLILLMNV